MSFYKIVLKSSSCELFLLYLMYEDCQNEYKRIK